MEHGRSVHNRRICGQHSRDTFSSDNHQKLKWHRANNSKCKALLFWGANERDSRILAVICVFVAVPAVVAGWAAASVVGGAEIDASAIFTWTYDTNQDSTRTKQQQQSSSSSNNNALIKTTTKHQHQNNQSRTENERQFQDNTMRPHRQY